LNLSNPSGPARKNPALKTPQLTIQTITVAPILTLGENGRIRRMIG
jgi:hypothetical protein